MLIKNTFIDGVTITKSNEVSQLLFTNDSGKIVYRDKIDSLIGIKHPGIILGTDIYGTTWVIHNHYEIGHPEIVTWEQFSLGVEVFYDTRPISYDRFEIVSRAIEYWVNKKEYSWLYHNCQHFVNKVTRNIFQSESLDRIGNNLIAVGLTGGVLGHASKNKVGGNLGLAAAFLGLIVKVASK
jgi:hypothetical protein